MIDVKDKDAVVQLAESLRDNPELGFSEHRSSDLVRRYWQSLGLEVQGPIGITGLKARIKGSHPGPTVALIGELDAIISPLNKYAAPSGAAHACGHNLQVAQISGAASALLGAREELYGDVVLIAVPAEEFIELSKRLEMKREGRIAFLSGKPELLRRGAFDDVDMAAMIHAQPSCRDFSLFMEGTNLGFKAKSIRFIGKAAHGAEPFEGRNALQAASLFMAGVNANRETFRDDESIRIHPIITKGGNAVNSVPDDVRIETYVRGASQKAILKGCAIVDRCVQAAALMIGCKGEMQTLAGYLPLRQDKTMSAVMESVAREVLGPDSLRYGVNSVGSSDIGDLSQLMPVIHPTMGGFEGELHSAEFAPVDLERSCVLGSRLLASLCLELLKDNAGRAKAVLEAYRPSLAREEYFDYLENKE